MSDINVVPYIDVMLVLLVIFMVTAPLITQGVQVNLPQADAEPVPAESTLPALITVDEFGDYYLTLDDGDAVPVDADTLTQRLREVLSVAPDTQVVVKGDASVDYGRVVDAMVMAQAAGAASVGLVTRPFERLN